jgi:ubiquinone/menaquinone biosynthesis C-methylase UbiE
MKPKLFDDPAALKRAVHDYWNAAPCNTNGVAAPRFTKQYFDEIERARYAAEPEIFSFAQFTRAHGSKVLEVGVGAGTDFLQWVRAGAQAYGVDLTEEAVEHARRRLDVYGLSAADVRVADAESLPYESDTFDVVYSWGVIHHTPHMERALSELVRVCRPGGRLKVMIYNRHSLLAYRTWVRFALLRGRPTRSLSQVLAHHVESAGTKAYTAKEARAMLRALPVHDVQVQAMLTYHDTLGDLGGRWQAVATLAANLLGGNRAGWFLGLQATKDGDSSAR